jgi:hypothetical protein
MEEKRSTVVPILLAVVLLTVLPTSAYFGAYFFRSDVGILRTLPDGSMTDLRVFRTKWEARLFTPAARVESLLSGENVRTTQPIVHRPIVGSFHNVPLD